MIPQLFMSVPLMNNRRKVTINKNQTILNGYPLRISQSNGINDKIVNIYHSICRSLFPYYIIMHSLIIRTTMVVIVPCYFDAHIIDVLLYRSGYPERRAGA